MKYTLEEITTLIGEAIAKQEGFYLKKSVSKTNNNPGNLRTWGNNPIRNGFAYFISKKEGFNALHKQILLNINRRLTFLEFFQGKENIYYGYAPLKDQNNPFLYATNVVQYLNSTGLKYKGEPLNINILIKDLVT